MKKVLVAGAALMLVSGIASTASAAAVEPGVKITGDARVRTFYRSDDYRTTNYGQGTTTATAANVATGAPAIPAGSQAVTTLTGNNPASYTGYQPYTTATQYRASDFSDTLDMDNRVRINIKGTAAGGAYAFARIRMMETTMGDFDTDTGSINNLNQNNIWVDQAFTGIPLGDMVTVEIGKYRTTYGPLPVQNNWFYDDVNSSGARGIVKVNENLEINPFFDWLSESQSVYYTTGSGLDYATPRDFRDDNDQFRYGVHGKYKINKDWLVGGMLGYQNDERNETQVPAIPATNVGGFPTGTTKNSGGFGSIYTMGKSGAFSIVGELSVTAADINGMSAWLEDSNSNYVNTYFITQSGTVDNIGSNDTGFGGFVHPSFTIDKLTLTVPLGFTTGGFLPDRAYGFVMLGGTDNSIITRQQIGATGDWMWIGLQANYKFTEALQLTGNLVYADVSPWDSPGDGPGWTNAQNSIALDSAWELSAVLQYTISKGMDVSLSAGYLDPSLEYVNRTAATNTIPLVEDAAFGTVAKFELKF